MSSREMQTNGQGKGKTMHVIASTPERAVELRRAILAGECEMRQAGYWVDAEVGWGELWRWAEASERYYGERGGRDGKDGRVWGYNIIEQPKHPERPRLVVMTEDVFNDLTGIKTRTRRDEVVG